MQALNLNKLFKFYVVVCLLFMISMLFLGVQKRVLRVDMYGISFINVINENQSNHPLRNSSGIKETDTSIVNIENKKETEDDNTIRKMKENELIDGPPLENPNNKSDEAMQSKLSSNETSIESHVSIPPLTCIDRSIRGITNFNPFISQQELCENDYGCGMLQTWRQQKMTMCEKSHQNQLRSYNGHYSSICNIPSYCM